MNDMVFEVSDAIEIINQTLEYGFPTIAVAGEVSQFKINQKKWVFFDLKDDEGSLSCFMSLFNLRTEIEDGMRVVVVARPRLTKWGKFSLTVEQIKPLGEGNLKKSFELLLAKLDKEGLLAPERKRPLPILPMRIGIISSTDAAGYKDFIKILGARFSGTHIEVYHTQVQGLDAPDQIMRGIDFFNESSEPPEVIAILRGGGSVDDLAAFNDEHLVRKIASSRVPIITGIGHEVDTTLADLAADVRASTPSNVAEILLPDKREIVAELDAKLTQVINNTKLNLEIAVQKVEDSRVHIKQKLEQIFANVEQKFNHLEITLKQLDPEIVLRRGYAIVRAGDGKIAQNVVVGDKLSIENSKLIINVEVENVEKRKNN
jgi:exodeoxyribonuclease VII large subunit